MAQYSEDRISNRVINHRKRAVEDLRVVAKYLTEKADEIEGGARLDYLGHAFERLQSATQRLGKVEALLDLEDLLEEQE